MGIRWDFTAQEVKEHVDKMLNEKINRFCIDCYNNLVVLSPVDTGRYRNSHHFSVNAPSYAISGAISVRIPIGEYPIIYLQNNLPYAVRIENGWSKQAPTGVYANAFHSAVANL